MTRGKDVLLFFSALLLSQRYVTFYFFQCDFAASVQPVSFMTSASLTWPAALRCAAPSERGSGPVLIEGALQRLVTRQLGNYGDHSGEMAGGTEGERSRGKQQRGTACLRCLSWPRRLIHSFSGAHQRETFLHPLFRRLEQHQAENKRLIILLPGQNFH